MSAVSTGLMGAQWDFRVSALVGDFVGQIKEPREGHRPKPQKFLREKKSYKNYIKGLCFHCTLIFSLGGIEIDLSLETME